MNNTPGLRRLPRPGPGVLLIYSITNNCRCLVPVTFYKRVRQIFIAIVCIIRRPSITDKYIIPRFFTTTKIYIAQRCALIKCTRVNFLYTTRNINIPQRIAELECLTTDFRNIFWKRYFNQCCTMPKCHFANRRH